ncbi:phasin family protein [Cupriavidus basilensis]|uniref:Phasin family protein n=1 Tax=Cupriavidus basilensis TaxID=68895 RepID=A0ABT6ALC5_9BURK|nr:phasin family protein [Cupriavidus basilensis]MDF3833408.1 phasin family protein [Cupriavidus basilensis]
MADQTNVPLDFLTFNYEVGLRALTLLQESRQRFLEVQLDAIRKDIKTSHEASAQLAKASDFAALATLPAAFLRNAAEQCAETMQAWMSLAIHNQSAMVEQMRETGESWQRCQAATLQQAGNASPLSAPMQDIFEKFRQAAAWTPAGSGADDSTAATTRKRAVHAS